MGQEEQQVTAFPALPEVISSDSGKGCTWGWRRAGVREGHRGEPMGYIWVDREIRSSAVPFPHLLPGPQFLLLIAWG
jgi:hypothetical protein